MESGNTSTTKGLPRRFAFVHLFCTVKRYTVRTKPNVPLERTSPESTMSPDFDTTIATTTAELEQIATEELDSNEVQDALNDAERDDAW